MGDTKPYIVHVISSTVFEYMFRGRQLQVEKQK